MAIYEVHNLQEFLDALNSANASDTISVVENIDAKQQQTEYLSSLSIPCFIEGNGKEISGLTIEITSNFAINFSLSSSAIHNLNITNLTLKLRSSSYSIYTIFQMNSNGTKLYNCKISMSIDMDYPVIICQGNYYGSSLIEKCSFNVKFNGNKNLSHTYNIGLIDQGTYKNCMFMITGESIYQRLISGNSSYRTSFYNCGILIINASLSGDNITFIYYTSFYNSYIAIDNCTNFRQGQIEYNGVSFNNFLFCVNNYNYIDGTTSTPVDVSYFNNYLISKTDMQDFEKLQQRGFLP